jgi:hypothetical protein
MQMFVSDPTSLFCWIETLQFPIHPHYIRP